MSEPNSNKTSFGEATIALTEPFSPTLNLRWLITTIDSCATTNLHGECDEEFVRELQQAWQGDKGTIKWRTIPEVEEDFRDNKLGLQAIADDDPPQLGGDISGGHVN